MRKRDGGLSIAGFGARYARGQMRSPYAQEAGEVSVGVELFLLKVVGHQRVQQNVVVTVVARHVSRQRHTTLFLLFLLQKETYVTRFFLIT